MAATWDFARAHQQLFVDGRRIASAGPGAKGWPWSTIAVGGKKKTSGIGISKADTRSLPMQAVFHGGAADSHAAGVAQARAVLDGPDGAPEAFLVLNDQGCMGVIFELMRRKLDIPGDIGVMGLANKVIEIPCPVPLTRLDNDPRQNALREIEELMAVIETRAPKPVSVEAQFVVGESCGERMKRRRNHNYQAKGERR